MIFINSPVRYSLESLWLFLPPENIINRVVGEYTDFLCFKFSAANMKTSVKNIGTIAEIHCNINETFC